MPKEMFGDVVWDVKDLTRLIWSERASSSSGTAGTYLKSCEGSGPDMTYCKLSRFNGLEIDGHECVNARVEIDGKEHVTWLNSSPSFRKPEERRLASARSMTCISKATRLPISRV